VRDVRLLGRDCCKNVPGIGVLRRHPQDCSSLHVTRRRASDRSRGRSCLSAASDHDSPADHVDRVRSACWNATSFADPEYVMIQIAQCLLRVGDHALCVLRHHVPDTGTRGDCDYSKFFTTDPP